MHTTIFRRSWLTRSIAAVAVGTIFFLSGCATDGVSDQSWRPFKKNAATGRDVPVQRQVKADSFPTAQEAGVLPSGN